MATKKQHELDQKNVQSCLTIIRQLYVDHTPDEITQAFVINRAEIEAVKEQIRLENEIANMQENLDSITKPIDS